MTWIDEKFEKDGEIYACTMECNWCKAKQLWYDSELGDDKDIEIGNGVNGWHSIEEYAHDGEGDIEIGAIIRHICSKCYEEYLRRNEMIYLVRVPRDDLVLCIEDDCDDYNFETNGCNANMQRFDKDAPNLDDDIVCAKNWPKGYRVEIEERKNS